MNSVYFIKEYNYLICLSFSLDVEDFEYLYNFKFYNFNNTFNKLY